MAAAFLTALSAASVTLASPANITATSDGVASQTSTSAQYACSNGQSLGVSYVVVEGLPAVIVDFPRAPDSRERVRRLLPASQTAGGVRYASDITVFHEAGENTYFATAASAQSDAIERTHCTLSSAASSPADAPHAAQPAHAGSYFVQSYEGPGYFPVESICFSPTGQNFFAINPAAASGRVVTYNATKARQSQISRVDAGAGQRRYTLNALDNPHNTLELNFIAQGMRESDLPSATSGLMRVSGNDNSIECVENDRIVYAGTSDRLGVAITLEDDGLTLREFEEGSPIATADPIKGAYILRMEREIEFYFFADDRHSRVVAHRNGANAPYAWRLGRWNGQIGLMPLAYFIADDEVLPSDLRTISPATVSLLDRLGSCNHLAGEASSDVSRNQVLSKQIEELNCDGLINETDALIARLPSQSPLSLYLKNNGPVYR